MSYEDLTPEERAAWKKEVGITEHSGGFTLGATESTPPPVRDPYYDKWIVDVGEPTTEQIDGDEVITSSDDRSEMELYAGDYITNNIKSRHFTIHTEFGTIGITCQREPLAGGKRELHISVDDVAPFDYSITVTDGCGATYYVDTSPKEG